MDLCCSGSSYTSLEFFKQNYENFKPIKSILVFQNNANFLFYDYNIPEDNINMVIENCNGERMFLGLNCGYMGTGPHKTLELLRYLNVDNNIAEECVYSKSFEIDFKDKYTKNLSYNTNKNIFFDYYNSNVLCELGSDCRVNIVDREIYMKYPEKNNFIGLFSCAVKTKASMIEYYVGYNSPMKYNVDFFSYIGRNITPNLIIKGHYFDIYATIEKDSLIPIISVLSKKLIPHKKFGNEFYYNIIGNNLKLLDLIKIIFRKIPKEYYGQIKIK